MASLPHPNSSGSDYTSPGTIQGSIQRENVVRRPGVADLVMDAARSCPEAIALSWGADTLTFGGLAARSRRLATYLIELGAGPEVPVGLCLERSFDFIVSAFAVLLSGAAYLPLDPSWPAARLRTILDDAKAPLVISRGSLANLAAGNGTHTIDLDTAADTIQRCHRLREPVAITRETLAYVIYTSGSTGQPKGVEV